MTAQILRFARPLGAPRYVAYTVGAIAAWATAPIALWASCVEAYAYSLKAWGMK